MRVCAHGSLPVSEEAQPPCWLCIRDLCLPWGKCRCPPRRLQTSLIGTGLAGFLEVSTKQVKPFPSYSAAHCPGSVGWGKDLDAHLRQKP